MKPAPVSNIRQWIAMAYEANRDRTRSEASLIMMLEVYARHLAQHPADVVRHVLEQVTVGKLKTRDGERWWLPLGDLIDACDEASDFRNKVRAAIERAASGEQAHAISEVYFEREGGGYTSGPVSA